jgi:hypothetical protein
MEECVLKHAAMAVPEETLVPFASELASNSVAILRAFMGSSEAIGRKESLWTGCNCNESKGIQFAAAPAPPASFHSQARMEEAVYNRNLFLHLREDESVSIHPIWVFWVEGHEFVE